MNHQLKKIKHLKESNNAIFQELFGFGKKEQPQKGEAGNLNPNGLLYDDEIVTILPNWNVKFNSTGSVISKPLPGYSVFTNVDWNGSMKWLVNSEFTAESVQVKDKDVDRFIGGSWYSGTFRGRAFIKSQFGMKNGDKAFFAGEKFIDSTWMPSPYYFVDGSTNEVDTILGLRNIETLNQNKFDINVIAVTPGRKIIMILEDGTTHEVTILKRLDEKNSSFQYRIKNGYTKEMFNLTLKWSAIRGNSVEEFNNLTKLSNFNIPLLFTNVFGIEFNSPIQKLIITDSTEYGQKNVEIGAENQGETPADLSKKQDKMDLSSISFLGIEKIPRKGGSETSLYFNFPTQHEKDGYNLIVDALGKGWIKAYITQIKSALDNNVIKGAPSNFTYLSNIIGKDDSLSIDLMDKNLVGALTGLNSFLKYFVDMMVRRVRKSGAEAGIYDVEDKIGKKIIKDRLKSLLGIEQEQSPKINTPKPKDGGSEKMKFAESIDVVGLIKNILSENLKHF